MLNLVYYPDRWRSRDTHMYQIVGRLLDSQHLLLAELTYREGARKPWIDRVSVYSP